MVIKHLNAYTFDVFWNTGWKWWARFQRTKDGSLKHIGGKHMPIKLFQQFRSIINKKGKRRQLAAAEQELAKLQQQESHHETSDIVGKVVL